VLELAQELVQVQLLKVVFKHQVSLLNMVVLIQTLTLSWLWH
jgi:hypothetical protein